ncbi:MAG: CopG family transcriptional regulator [Verrucomicrobiaceae bacterium]|nr:CopG family transcriptional regulator [Verrucomicrobiaceae bacterium]
MNSAKIAISIESSLLQRIDALVTSRVFRSRSEVFQLAVAEHIERFDYDILARECAKLDPIEEQAFADLGLSNDITEWPEY